jgi:hypothetical protein
MKAKELISILQACDPESEIVCKWRGNTERDMDYRMACSWLVLNEELPYGKGSDALDTFEIIGAKIRSTDNKEKDLLCTLTIDQGYYNKLFVMETAEKLKAEEYAK